ncbi:hypothetical protein D5086_017240 [Populus alba]|uniref:Uncharacterized protein n=1 Tax=Populus alba TaxID=43335 RepID=A0ACC4BW67_POPAL
MHAIVIDVPIDLVTYFIEVIQKAFSDKESSFLFRGLITTVVILAKVPLRDVEPIMKMLGKIFAITIVKYEAIVVNKKRPFFDEFTSSQQESPSTNPLLPLIIKQLWFLINKFDSFTRRWDQKDGKVDKLLFDIQQDMVQVNDRLVQLGLDVEQIYHTIIGDDDDENLD